ncbi:hypothetical protein B1729_09935 [Microbacterium sp. B35-04]|uniref:hypothetical protein n=1 Tax=Microbacterium sp. B35-04 TaxID=1961716 RepID=UPI0013D05CD2|nr:hypothetical protein [Microbacterium sp. B35-04]KAF2413430.1 hypothetical protein B1729_09935 [Microbacterium sp. B35-04]
MLSIASQGIGVLQLLTLLARVGANETTDAYLYLFNMGMLPTQIIVVGVLFPMLLNKHKMTSRLAERIRVSTPVLAIVLVGAGTFWMWLNGRMESTLFPVVLAVAINAFFQSCVWIRAVSAEAIGDPRWMAAVALPSNALALVVLLLPIPGDYLVTSMVAALALGNIALLITQTVRGVGTQSWTTLSRDPNAKSLGAGWFLTKAGVGYGGLAVIQSLAVALPPSALTILSVATKIVGSVVATFVNAVMPRIVHRDTNTVRPAMRFLAFAYVGAGCIGLTLVGAAAAFRPDFLQLAAITGLWLAASVGNSVAQRAAYRFLPANASRITIVVVPAVAALAITSSFAKNFQLETLVSAYAAIDGVSAMLFLAAMSRWRVAAVAATVCLGIAGVWIASLM